MGAAASRIEFKASWILEATLRDLRRGIRYIWHEGGSRSSKTYSISAAQALHLQATDETLDIVRLTNPDIKGSVLLDMLEVLERLDLYDPGLHHKTDQVIRLKGGRGRIRYFGVENEQKLRGWKRDHLWMNEANEISDAKRRQLWMRTTKSITLDHNPTVDDAHWIVKRLAPKVATGECTHYHSSYVDNPFLDEAIIKEIEGMQYDDPWGWQVYGLGLRGSNPAAVFEHRSYGAFEPQGDTVLSVDFGMKDPFVVCEWGWRDSNPPSRPRASLYCRPWLYATNLTTGEAIERMDEMGVPKDVPMWCDSAEPDRIRELQQAGYDAWGVKKGPGTVDAGYAWLRGKEMIVEPGRDTSEAVYQELGRTRHKKRPGVDEYTDKVVDADNHVADCARYGPFTTWGRDQDWGAW